MIGDRQKYTARIKGRCHHCKSDKVAKIVEFGIVRVQCYDCSAFGVGNSVREGWAALRKNAGSCQRKGEDLSPKAQAARTPTVKPLAPLDRFRKKLGLI